MKNAPNSGTKLSPPGEHWPDCGQVRRIVLEVGIHHRHDRPAGDAAALTVGPDGDQPYPWQPGHRRDPQQTHVLAALCRHGVFRRVQHGKNQDFGRHVLPSRAGRHLVADRAVQGA